MPLKLGGRLELGHRPLGLRIAGSRAFRPDQIAGLELWLDANQLALANNDPVASWTDMSGSGRHATQGTAANQPTFKTNVQNGKPGVLFDGVDDRLGGITLPADASRTIFFAAKASAATSGRTLAEMFGTNARWYINGTQWAFEKDQAGLTVNLGGTVTNASIIASKLTSAASMSCYVNGGAATTFDPNDSISTATGMGLGMNPNTNFFPGYMFEVLIYNSALSDADRGNVRDYLNTQWAAY